MEVLFYPYLPLRERVNAGPWELIPISDVGRADLELPDQLELVQGLFEMYRLPDDAQAMGAIARQRDGSIGNDFDRGAMATLGRAILLALLDTNPDFLAPEAETGNAGHAAVTSDNAVGFGHPLDATGHIAVQYGALVRTLVGGLDVFEQAGEIPHPPELRTPLLGREIESYCLDSTYVFLAEPNPEARRLGQVLDLLGNAWRNTVSVTPEMRIVQLKTAFEVLLNVGDSLDPQRGALSSLLDPPDVARVSQTWVNRKGKEIQADLSELEWWFQEFTFLRNNITHGDEVVGSDFDFDDGAHHVFLASAYLQTAIKELIARAGSPDIRMDHGSRKIRAAYRAAGVDPDTLEPLDET